MKVEFDGIIAVQTTDNRIYVYEGNILKMVIAVSEWITEAEIIATVKQMNAIMATESEG